jgi:hypothetical protein
MNKRIRVTLAVASAVASIGSALALLGAPLKW